VCETIEGNIHSRGSSYWVPVGAIYNKGKNYETRDAIQCGATEIDIVINIRELQMGNYELI
jgi:deoxyribose-phosphate aldolase